MSPDRCPSDQQLRAFQLGELAEPLLSEVAGHLERCPQCENRARQLDTERDAVLAGLRDSSSVLQNSPDAATILPPVAGPPMARPAAAESSAPVSYTFLGPAQRSGEMGRLGNYRVLRLLGKGGMGYVFHAEDISLGRAVALKVMKPELGGEADNWQRFVREARMMAALKHDHLVTVYQVGQENGVFFIAMELLEGTSLLDRLKGGAPLEAGQIVRLAREMATALAAIHRQGLVHRDIKPANIWLEAPGDRVKLLDFGLARTVHDDIHLTQTGVVIGTPSFMSPEQARGSVVDARSDLFSLGTVMYCMCTGTVPFSGPHVTAVLTALAVDTPPPARAVNAAIPPALSDLVTQLLAKKPEQRPASADTVVECLRQIEGGAALPQAIPAGPSDRLKSWFAGLSQRQRLAALAIVLLVIAGVGISMVRGPSRRSPHGGAASTSQAESPVYLKNLKPIDPVNWPLPPAPNGESLPNFFRVISVNGIVSPNGIGMHPSFDGPASVSFSLDKPYRTFQAKVSLNDSSDGSKSPMIFFVYGNGNLLWQSKPIRSHKDSDECKLPLEDVRTLKLEVATTGIAMGAHGVWLEPRLTE